MDEQLGISYPDQRPHYLGGQQHGSSRYCNQQQKQIHRHYQLYYFVVLAIAIHQVQVLRLHSLAVSQFDRFAMWNVY